MDTSGRLNTVAMILAGGQGSRLATLSEARAKPAVPFAGRYRIIDFTLSNAMHAGIPHCGFLTQYRPYSLMNHLAEPECWGYSGRGRTAAVLPPYRGHSDASWYEGTADAIHQNLGFINRFECDAVLVLSGDHIYKMAYDRLLAFHRDNGADLTIACQAVPWDQTSRFGVMKINQESRIVDFQEKPQSDPVSNLASLGIYVFRREALEDRLHEDAADPNSSHDFGNDIIPRMIREDRVYCYAFEGYWRDVGTIASYWEANMEALEPASGLDLEAWDVRTNIRSTLSVSHRPLRITGQGCVRGSLISQGCLIEGHVERSVLSPGVIVREGARVSNSVILDSVVIGKNTVVDSAIIDKRTIVGDNIVIGQGDPAPNAEHPDLLEQGLTIIGKEVRLPAGLQIGRHCLIRSQTQEDAFSNSELASGATVG